MVYQSDALPELAKTISHQVDTLTAELEKRGYPQPSFKVDGPLNYPPEGEIQVARLGLLDAARKLVQLATGPTDFTVNHFLGVSEDTTTVAGLTTLVLTNFILAQI